jgi:hypothetical protein
VRRYAILTQREWEAAGLHAPRIAEAPDGYYVTRHLFRQCSPFVAFAMRDAEPDPQVVFRVSEHVERDGKLTREILSVLPLRTVRPIELRIPKVFK